MDSNELMSWHRRLNCAPDEQRRRTWPPDFCRSGVQGTVDTPSARTDNTTGAIGRDCPLCGDGSGDVERLPYGSRDWPMVKCPDCEFVYLDRAPGYEALSTTLAWERTSKIEDQRRLTERPVSKRLSPATPRRMQKGRTTWKGKGCTN